MPTVCTDAQSPNSHSQVVAGDEVAEARMERLDVVVLEVDLDEGLPVVVALVDLDAVEHVAREVEVAHAERREVARDVARAVEQQAVPVLQRRAAEVEARLVGEVRRAEQLALAGRRSSGGSGRRCSARCRGPCSMIACRCRQMLDRSSTPLRVAHERLRVVAPRRARDSRPGSAPSARARRSRARARTAAAARRRRPRDRSTRRPEAATWRAADARPWRDRTSAYPFVAISVAIATNPTQQPGTITAVASKPPRTALLSRPRERIASGRVVKRCYYKRPRHTGQT